MDIKFTEFGRGKIKILFDWDTMFDWFKIDFEKVNKDDDYHFFFLKKNQIVSLFKHNFLNRVSFKDLDKTYKNNELLKQYYHNLLKFCLDNKIKHIVFMNTGQYWHPEFLRQLRKNNIIIALYTADDDSNTIKYCSLPYTKYYDYHFHVGVMFDNKRTIADVFREYGSKNPIWIPLGAKASCVNTYVDFGNRDIDICYIGNMNSLKFFRISKLERYFGDKLKLYGAQGNGDWKSLKGIFYKICNKIFGFGYIEKLSDQKIKEIYARTKIGFNLHLIPYKGPSNMRMYELPANGVMQLCDNEIGLPRIFEIGNEVVAYHNIDDAIQKIEYYLKHDKERIEIAKAGYVRARKEYLFEDTLKKIFKNILQ